MDQADARSVSGSEPSVAEPETVSGSRAPAEPPARYSPFVRSPDFEPQGRWLEGRPTLRWPDTVIQTEFVRWIPRILLLATAVLTALTINILTDVRTYFVLLALIAVAFGWQQWWDRWDMTSLPPRLLAFGVQWALAMAMVALNPLASFFGFSLFMISGTLFTGWWLVCCLLLTAGTVSVGQIGGVTQFSTSIPTYLSLIAVNFLIALAFITLSNRREEAVQRRDAALQELIVTQQANVDLQEQLVSKARDTGMLDERARLARELHDTVAQGLVAVVTQLEAIDDAQVRSPEVAKRVERAKDLARQSLGEARRAVNALRPPALDDRGLPDALEHLVAEWAEINGISALRQVSGEPRATDHDPVLVRVAQEALSNIARHAEATKVAVTLTYLDDEVLLDIGDNGTGFDPADRPDRGSAGGHGLPGMCERLDLAGGRLAIESEPGGGCVVSAAVPG